MHKTRCARETAFCEATLTHYVSLVTHHLTTSSLRVFTDPAARRVTT